MTEADVRGFLGGLARRSLNEAGDVDDGFIEWWIGMEFVGVEWSPSTE